MAKKHEGQARLNRIEAVEAYYPLAIEAVPDPSRGLMPALYDFLELPTVRLLWKPDGADDSEAAFTELLDSIVTDIEGHQEKSRVKAIRSILAATRGVPVSTLSSKSSAYPPEDYDSEFFNLATSVFCDSSSKKVLTFPQLAGSADHRSRLLEGISLHQTDAIIAMIEAAELDTDTATWEDLVELGVRFKWTNETPVPQHRYRSPNYYTSRSVWNCEQLVSSILSIPLVKLCL